MMLNKTVHLLLLVKDFYFLEYNFHFDVYSLIIRIYVSVIGIVEVGYHYIGTSDDYFNSNQYL